MSYKPPVGRMHQIKKNAPARTPASESKTMKVDVGVMTATVDAGEDGKLGTEDDKVTIKPKARKKAAKKARK